MVKENSEKKKSKSELLKEWDYTTVSVNGVDVIIRKPPMKLIAEVIAKVSKFGKIEQESVFDIIRDHPDLIDEIFNLMDEILISCVVDPKIVKSGSADENTLLIDDIDYQSYIILIKAIFEDIFEDIREKLEKI